MALRVSFTRIAVRFACVAALAMTCAGGGGCTTAAVATAGTVAGIAASAVSTGADVYRMGKLDSADEARFDQWIAAAHAAAADLHLTIRKQADSGKGEWRCTLADDRKSTIGIYVERRTETLLRTRIDVGVFGSEPTARLILTRMRVHAERANAKAGNAPATAPSGDQAASPL
jgi:hypothetical protein